MHYPITRDIPGAGRTGPASGPRFVRHGTSAPTVSGGRPAVKGNRIAVVTDRDTDVIEVHPPSLGSVDPGGFTVEQCPPAPVAG